MENENVKLDEYREVHENEPKKELENYRTFMYYYEDMFDNDDNSTNQFSNQQESMTIKKHIVDGELHSGDDLLSKVRIFFNFFSEISLH